jgi:hypothetical protein
MDFPKRRVACGDPLNHRHVDLRIGTLDRPTIDREKALDGEEGAALVVVEQGVISCQVFDQSGDLLDQRHVGLLVTEARARDGERGVGKADSRQACDLFWTRPQQSAAMRQ